jgi:hypothetical protein
VARLTGGLLDGGGPTPKINEVLLEQTVDNAGGSVPTHLVRPTESPLPRVRRITPFARSCRCAGSGATAVRERNFSGCRSSGLKTIGCHRLILSPRRSSAPLPTWLLPLLLVGMWHQPGPFTVCTSREGRAPNRPTHPDADQWSPSQAGKNLPPEMTQVSGMSSWCEARDAFFPGTASGN